MPETIADILSEEVINLPPRVAEVCDVIEAKHAGRVLAFIYYGSSLRDVDNPEKMLDFYVIVDSYRKTHKNPVRAALNAMFPPAVYYLEHTDNQGVTSICKYSIMSIKAFEKRCTAKALLSQTWGRFSQPCALLRPKSDDITARIIAARETAIRHIAAETAPLFKATVSQQSFWSRAFHESYRTELRPESSAERSAEIVARYLPRYERLSVILYQVDRGQIYLPDNPRSGAKMRWFFRRILGKPMTAIRVLNSAATFDGGLDYVLRKLKNHSGVTIDPSPSQRRHPVLWSPVLAWKLWRKGAFN
jgi:hypothetical protein